MSEKKANAAGVDMSSLLKFQIDVSSLTTLLTTLSNSSKAYGEQLKALEESDRQNVLSRDRTNERLTELSGEVQKANDGVGEIRGLLGAMRGSVEKISPLFEGYVKKADMPCTRSDWESMKKAMKELQTATDRAAFQAHGTAAAETATYKAELAEMQVSQLELQKQMREMQKTMKSRDEEIRKLISAAPSQQSPKVQHGASALALMELGKKKLVESTPEPAIVEEVKPTPVTAPAVAAASVVVAPSAEAVTAAIDHSPVIEALTRELQSLSSQCTAMNTELTRVRAESKQFQNELSTLRSGFANVHASMPVPFVAPSTLPSSSLPQATMIAVSLVCDLCNEKNAVVFCVHCATNSQKLCESCDASVHAAAPGQPPIATNQTVGNAGKSMFTSSTPTPSEIKVSASDKAANAASKHLRLEISRAIQPGSKLMSSDLGFVKNQQESHAVSVVREGHMNLQKEISDLMERVDRHDLQFSSLAVSLNSLDDAETKLATMDREVKAVRIKLAEQERLLKVTKEDAEEMNVKLETIQASPALTSRHVGGAGGSPTVSEDGVASPPALPRKLSSFAKQENSNPMTAALAQQLHSELDAHRRQTEHAFLELVGKLETLQTVELDSLTQSIRALDKSKVDRSALLNQNEKLIAIESQLRSLVNSQGFASRKFSDHLDTWRESIAAWTCQHCNSNALAFGGMCAESDCKLRICWDCSKVASQGHVSELMANGSFGGGVGGAANLTQLQAVLDTTPAFQELQLKLRNIVHTTERQGVLLEIEGQQLHQMQELFNKMRLIVPGAGPTPEEKQLAHMKGLPVSNATSTLTLGPSSALLLDSRTLSYFESLQDLFQHSLPDILTKLMMLEKSNENNTTNLLHMDRWKREFDVASRPYVDDKFSQVALQLTLAEKSMKKAWKGEWKRYEMDFRAALQKEKIEEKEKAGLDSSIARVHYRCVACDQLILNQTGPLGKEFSHPQFAVHLHQQHLTHLQQQQLLPQHLQHTTQHVGGFASPAAPSHSGHNSYHSTSYLPPAPSSKVGTGSLDMYPDRLQSDYKEPSSLPPPTGSMTTPNRNNLGSRGGGRRGAAAHSTPSQPPINALPQLQMAFASSTFGNNSATPLPPRPPTVGSQSARRASKDLLDS